MSALVGYIVSEEICVFYRPYRMQQKSPNTSSNVEAERVSMQQ